VTVKIKPVGTEKPKQHLCTPAIAVATESDVIVVDHSGRTDVAAWGGLLSLAAQVKKVRGVIVDGAARDVDESRELEFPVFGKGAVQVTARSRVMQESFNEEIECAGVQVHPGDLVIADMSGVVFIPRAKEDDVLTQAEGLAAAEQRMAAAIKTGRSVVEVMETLGYEAMLSKDK
jgi:regulator of RNase E activity RraA